MYFCEKCGKSFYEETDICPNCKIKLAIYEEDFESGKYSSDLTLAYVCSEVYEAEMIKANLNGADIEAFILSQKDSSYPVVGNLSLIKIYVHKDAFELAQKIIRDINNTKT